MSNYKEYIFHFMTILMIILCVFCIVPNLSTDIKNYKEDNNIIASTRIDEREYRDRNFNKRVEHTLVILMTDNTEVKLSASEYSDFFDEIQNSDSLFKKITYFENGVANNMNPIQVEIDNKIIYDVHEAMKWKYLLIILTLCLSLYSGYKLRQYLILKT